MVGLVVRTGPGLRAKNAFEQAVLGKLPGYTFLRGAKRLTGRSEEHTLEPVLVEIEDAPVPALIVEKLEDGSYTVLVPSAPTPMAGSIYILPTDRVPSGRYSVHQGDRRVLEMGNRTVPGLRALRYDLPIRSPPWPCGRRSGCQRTWRRWSMGESQNDCVILIMFTIFVGLAVGSSSAPRAGAGPVFAREVLGKCALGLNVWLMIHVLMLLSTYLPTPAYLSRSARGLYVSGRTGAARLGSDRDQRRWPAQRQPDRAN